MCYSRGGYETAEKGCQDPSPGGSETPDGPSEQGKPRPVVSKSREPQVQNVWEPLLSVLDSIISLQLLKQLKDSQALRSRGRGSGSGSGSGSVPSSQF